MLRALVAEAHRIDTGEKILASSEERGRDREVGLVDEPGGEVLANGCGASADPNVFVSGCLLRAGERGVDAVGDEVERGSALHRDGGTSVVRQHEHGYVVRRVVAPPSLPVV